MKCGHCKRHGHTMPTCEKGRRDGCKLYEDVMNIIARDRFIEMSLENYLFHSSVHNLKLLMNYIGMRLNPVLQMLLEKGKITDQEALMRFKANRVKVLMWFFWYTSPQYRILCSMSHIQPCKKLSIQATNIPYSENQSNFDCPICMDTQPFKEKLICNCNHFVCKPCMVKYFEYIITNLNDPKPCCSLCRSPITIISFADNLYKKEVSNQYFDFVIPDE